jgi:hypothetical protein
VPPDLVLISGRTRRPKIPVGPTMSTVMDDWVAEKGPVFATRDSIVIRKELDEVSNKSGNSLRDLLFGRICDLDERHVKCRLIEDGLSDCVHLVRLDKEK